MATQAPHLGWRHTLTSLPTPLTRDLLNDPLIASHQYLLKYPLNPDERDAEGELMPTIRVQSDAEGSQVITLPAPAYDDLQDGYGLTLDRYSDGSCGGLTLL
jgi:hypothetical protein